MGVCVRWYHIVLICIFLRNNGAKHHFLCLLDVCVSSAIKYLTNFLSIKKCISLQENLLCAEYHNKLFASYTFYKYLCILFMICSLAFHSLNAVFCCINGLDFNEVQIINYFIMIITLMVYFKNIFLPKIIKIFSYVFWMLVYI